MKLILFLLFSSLFISVLSHLCIIDPPQRGALKYDIPGEDECFRPYTQCGKMPPQSPSVKKKAGKMDNVTFQQNYNHWMFSNPGSLDVAISYKVDTSPLSDSDFTILASISDFPAYEMVNYQNFTLQVKWPMKVCDHCVLRFRYITNNPDEAMPNNPNGIFYQCVDIQIVKPDESEEEKKVEPLVRKREEKVVAQPIVRKSEEKVAPFSCKPVKQFTAKAEGMFLTSGRSFEYTVYWDAVNKFARWDQSFYDTNLNLLFSWSLYTNYNTLREYVFNPATNSCDLTGPDAMYDWCYGCSPLMNYIGRMKCNHIVSTLCDTWTMNNGFTFTAIYNNMTKTCTPFGVTHQDASGQTTNYMRYYYFKQGIDDNSVFNLPSTCSKSTKKHLMH